MSEHFCSIPGREWYSCCHGGRKIASRSGKIAVICRKTLGHVRSINPKLLSTAFQASRVIALRCAFVAKSCYYYNIENIEEL